MSSGNGKHQTSIKEHLQEIGAKGGDARAKSITPERASEIARRAAQTRWGTRPVQASHAATLRIGDAVFVCANLPDGRRVISESHIMGALGRGYSGYYSERDNLDATTDPSAVLPRFLAPKVLKPYVSSHSSDLQLLRPVAFTGPTDGTDLPKGMVFKGVDAQALPMVCEIWLKARQDNKLKHPAQLATATKAEMLMRGLARVGIAALIDAATGYEKQRDREDLQRILDLYLRKELAAWTRRFPVQFYEEIFRLRGWTWRGMKVNRPQIVAKYTKDIIYARLAPGILAELERKNPMLPSGRRAGKHHQFFTDDIGHPALEQHFHAVLALMRASKDWEHFNVLVDAAFPKRGDTLELPIMQDE